MYHLERSSDLPRLKAFKFRDVAFTIAVSFLFPPLRCTAISFQDGGIKRLSLGYSCGVFEEFCGRNLSRLEHFWRRSKDVLELTRQVALIGETETMSDFEDREFT